MTFLDVFKGKIKSFSKKENNSNVQHFWIFSVVLWGFMILMPFVMIHSEPYTLVIYPQPIQSYRSPISPKVLVIIVDGLGAGPAFHPGWMPLLQNRMPHSAWGTALASFPTLTSPGLRTIFSGHPPLPRFVFPGGLKPLHEHDSLFRRAADAGLKSFAVGQQDWPAIFSGHGVNLKSVFYYGPQSRYDDLVLGEGLKIMKEKRWNILVLHLFDLDVIGHATGVGSATYLKQLAWLDNKIDELSAIAGTDSCILVTADHGQTKSGTHGGLEMEVRSVPFVLWGNGVRSVALGSFPQENIAPTLSAVLGLPPPAMTEGWPELEAIQISDRERSSVLLDLLNQRYRRWDSLRSKWSWLSRAPGKAAHKAWEAFQSKNYPKASELVIQTIRKMDSTISNISPLQWIGKLIVSFWLLILAGSFGFVWPKVYREHRIMTAALGLISLSSLSMVLITPALWSIASTLCLISVIGLLILSLLPGFQNVAQSWRNWTLWWMATMAIAFPIVLDTVIWSWTIVWLVCLIRLTESERPNRFLLILSLIILSVCSILSDWSFESETSLARYILYIPDLRTYWHPNWLVIEFLGIVGIATISWTYFKKISRASLRISLWAGALTLIGMSAIIAQWFPQRIVISWIACILFLAAALLLRIPQELEFFCLSITGLAFFCSMSNRIELCFFMAACFIGWELGWLYRTKNSLWEGLCLLGLCLWAYMIISGPLDFSHISVAEGYRLIGHEWHPRILVFLIVLKRIAIIATPALPLLSNLSFAGLMSVLLPLGSLSVGSLTILWFDYYLYRTSSGSPLDDRSFERIVHVMLLAWIFILLWLLGRILKLRGFKNLLDHARKYVQQ